MLNNAHSSHILLSSNAVNANMQANIGNNKHQVKNKQATTSSFASKKGSKTRLTQSVT